ncbi:MAG: glycosyltransferase family 39 protein, partial [Deltaproteobacteria bacterium]|nr:glycosyltransferase family 39 protein [Deltaproteobacteria bacterium]
MWVDEPWYASTAYNFLQGKGMVDVVGQSNWISLYPMLMSGFFMIFGATLFSARLFSILGGLIALVGFILILKNFQIKEKYLCWGALIFIFSNVNYIIFRTVRPEGWTVTFIVWGLYFLIQALQKNKLIHYFFSGFMITSAFLCHPNAALYIFGFALVVLIFALHKKKHSNFLAFLLGSGIIILALFSIIIFVKNQNLFDFFGRWLHRTSVKGAGITPIFQNFYSFYKSYTLGFKRLFIFIFEIGVLILGLSFFKRNKYIFIISSLGLGYFILAIFFLKPFATRHFAEILIFSFIAFVLIL